MKKGCSVEEIMYVGRQRRGNTERKLCGLF